MNPDTSLAGTIITTLLDDAQKAKGMIATVRRLSGGSRTWWLPSRTLCRTIFAVVALRTWYGLLKSLESPPWLSDQDRLLAAISAIDD